MTPEQARAALEAMREALDTIQSPLAIDGENHMAAVYLARRTLAREAAALLEPVVEPVCQHGEADWCLQCENEARAACGMAPQVEEKP
jgi:hypothetical protein